MGVISLCNSKGGCGKSCTASIILGSFAREGYRVAAIDADFNHSLSTWITSIADYPVTLRTETDETKIVPTVAELDEDHDVIVIDTAGAATQATVFAIGCADLVLIPTQLSSADIVEAIKTMKLTKSASQMTKRDILARILLTNFQGRTRVAAHTAVELERYKLPSLKTPLRQLTAFREMSFNGMVPSIGPAGDDVTALINEIKSLGIIETKQAA